jgi:uncharacterized protein YjbJ (UPF0337 family)
MVCIFYAHKKATTAATKGENQRIRIKCLARLARRMGKVLQEVGETLGNEKPANQGVVDQAKGAAKETWGQRQKRCPRSATVAQERRYRQGARAAEQD